MALFRRKPVPIEIVHNNADFQQIAGEYQRLIDDLNAAVENAKKVSKDSADQMNRATRAMNQAASRLEQAERRMARVR